jgi:hypothetical protein
MATTTTAYEAELLAGGFLLSERGQMAGMAYRLRQQYGMGVTDPAAHTNAKMNPKHVAMTNNKGKMASFDAITAP